MDVRRPVRDAHQEAVNPFTFPIFFFLAFLFPATPHFRSYRTGLPSAFATKFEALPKTLTPKRLASLRKNGEALQG